MKSIFLILFLTFSATLGYADCDIGSMNFFPSSTEISLNSMFIIEAYALNEKTINSFGNRRIYLESDIGELVELNLREILKGQMDITQAIFSPARELKTDTRYFLRYSDQTKDEERAMRRYNRKNKEMEKVYWKTSDQTTLENLDSNLLIEFDKTEVVYFGCGPSAYAIFNVENESESEIWYKTEVLDLESDNSQVYYIKAYKGKLNVGHGMCSGAFIFANKGRYKVRFTPMNSDGKSLERTDWISFASPFLDDKNSSGN